jgi:hypothetical protein
MDSVSLAETDRGATVRGGHPTEPDDGKDVPVNGHWLIVVAVNKLRSSLLGEDESAMFDVVSSDAYGEPRQVGYCATFKAPTEMVGAFCSQR